MPNILKYSDNLVQLFEWIIFTIVAYDIFNQMFQH